MTMATKTMDRVFFPFGLSLLLCCWDPVLVGFFKLHIYRYMITLFNCVLVLKISIESSLTSMSSPVSALFLRGNVAICIDATPNDDFRNFASRYCRGGNSWGSPVSAFSSRQPVTNIIWSDIIPLNFTSLWARAYIRISSHFGSENVCGILVQKKKSQYKHSKVYIKIFRR